MSKLLLPLVFILASIVVIVLFLFPGWQHFLSVRADTRHLEEVNTEIDGLLAKRDQLVDQINGITKENVERIDQFIPFGAHGPEFLVYLERLATSHKLSIRKLDLADTVSTKEKVPKPSVEGFAIGQGSTKPLPYDTLKVHMEVAGPYEFFKDFLRELESSIRITDVTSVVLGSEEGAFIFTFSLQTYY